jgi:hypothetical protein
MVDCGLGIRGGLRGAGMALVLTFGIGSLAIFGAAGSFPRGLSGARPVFLAMTDSSVRTVNLLLNGRGFPGRYQLLISNQPAPEAW